MTATLSLSDLASRLNLQRGQHGFRGACPACGYPNAFSMRPGRGDRIGLFCASCGDRDAIEDAVVRLVGGVWTPPGTVNPASDLGGCQRNQERAASLWNGSVPAAGTIADIYLTGRALPELATSSALRFRSDCPHPDGSRLPAMVAAVFGPNGAMMALHRTFLRQDGTGKANVQPPRASLAPVWGGAVRLHDLNREKPLVVGEGIESAASAGVLMGLPAWSAISAGNLAAGLMLPREAHSVVIATDPDEPGERAARAAAARWSGEGRHVRLARPRGSGDFNDILLEVSHA
jgi:putative DNA primase/helicase